MPQKRKVRDKLLATVRTAYPELEPLFHQRLREEGYKSMSDYFHWQGVYDLLLRRPHHVSAHIAHLSAERQEEAIRYIIEHFDDPPHQRPGAYFEARVVEAAHEETYRMHATIRELRDENRELKQELARERSQGKLGG